LQNLIGFAQAGYQGDYE